MNKINLAALLKERRGRIVAASALLVLIAAALALYMLFGRSANSDADGPCPGSEVLYWYDPMAPDRRFDQPGKSPFMDMDLIPKCAEETSQGVTVSPAMQQNLGVRVARAEMRDIAPTVRAVGRVELDERLIAEVQTLTPGFVESLSVRAEGEPIRQGMRVATVYSPDLLAAQNEYKAVLGMPGDIATASLKRAARERLRLLGLPSAMIQRLERGGAPQRTYPVFAPVSGIVREIGARPGAQVSPGQSLVTITGLSRVWVIAEVPETALRDVRIGQPAEVTFVAFPGEVRTGSVDYIFPTMDAQSRTARVRITLGNPGQRLLAGMFANVTLTAAGGTALVVPTEAVIDTGRRKVVIVRRNGGFFPAEVETGRELDDWTEVLAGVQRGDEVVVSGQFLIDSEASLSGVLDRLQAQPAQTATPPTSGRGIIRSLNPQQSQVTVAHEPIPALRWPAMTMTFTIRDQALLRGFTRGDPVQFELERRGESYVITRMSKVTAPAAASHGDHQ